MHISGTFKEQEKANIQDEKANIDAEKVTIIVQKVLGLKPTRSSALLREMAEHGIIEPVFGHGKRKYRFCLLSKPNAKQRITVKERC